MNRRAALRLAGAVLLSGSGWRYAAAQGSDSQSGSDPVDPIEALIQCIDHHRKFRACFASKFRTGYCDFNGFDEAATTGAGLFRLLDIAGVRLTTLSGVRSTAALLYHVRDDGMMDVFLLDGTGPVGWDRVPGDIASLVGGLRLDLNVNARVATRSAVPIGMAARDKDVTTAVPIEEVSRRLLPGSVGERIANGGYERLLVLASGAVAQAPLPALKLPDGRFLIDQASVILLADPEALFLDDTAFAGGFEMAARALTFSFEDAMFGPKLMVGNPAFGKVEGWTLPPLPGAEAEIESVASEFMAQDVLVGNDATRQAIMAMLGQMQDNGGVAYFATHGVSDAVNPMDGSFLAVAGDVIRGQQIRRLKMTYKHPLVVMSACQSGLGKTFGGGGYGLARAWYAAGAGQVVGSLWNVSDEGTNYLMTRFARNAVSGSMSVEDALRTAMKGTRENFSDDPAIWASFVTFGNPSA